jgi:hypothetical protein
MTTLRSLINQTKSLLVSASLLVFSTSNYAGMTPVSDIINHQNGLSTVSVLIPSKNECSGPDHYFSTGGGFTECAISVISGTPKYLADVIAKFDETLIDDTAIDDDYEESTKYEAQVEASMWSFTDSNGDILIGNKGAGTWEYTNPNDYPDIRYWLAKAGSGNTGGFRLFWTIETSEANNCGIDENITTNLNYNCMNLAQSVTSGSWTTPQNNNESLKGLSHITFFGGLCESDNSCGDSSVSVPEPTTLAIFALGLIGLGVRRKQAMRIKQ